MILCHISYAPYFHLFVSGFAHYITATDVFLFISSFNSLKLSRSEIKINISVELWDLQYIFLQVCRCTQLPIFNINQLYPKADFHF